MPEFDFTTDWKLAHPFTVGQRVWAKSWSRAAAAVPAEGRVVWMRGASDRGLWLAFEGVPYEFAIEDFTAVPPMTAASASGDPSGEGAGMLRTVPLSRICDHGSRSVAGLRFPASEARPAQCPFGRFLPELPTPADTTLRRRGFQEGHPLTHTHHGSQPMRAHASCHGNLVS